MSPKASSNLNASNKSIEGFLTRAQVARRLAVSPNTVSRWAREGRLPCSVTLGGHRRFARSVIEQIAKDTMGKTQSREPERDE